jgi:flagellar assembly protein FliH
VVKPSSDAERVWAPPALAGPLISPRVRGAPVAAVEDRDHAWNAGFARGHADGWGAAAIEIEAHQIELREAVKAARSIASRLSQPLAEIDAVLEGELIRLAALVGAHLAYGELSAGSDRIRLLIAESLNALPSRRDRVRVFLHPADHAEISSGPADEAGGSDIEYRADAKIERGGVWLETDDSSLDARWRTRFDAALDAITGSGTLHQSRGDG